MRRFECLVLLYGGPDQLMPITSGLATVLAVLLMFWNKVAGFVARVFHRNQSGRPSEADPNRAAGSESGSNNISIAGSPEKR